MPELARKGEKIFRGIPVSPGVCQGKILVLGTGIGRESIALAKRGLHVVGLDISHAALRMAAQITRTAGVPIAFVQANFLALPAHPAQFDYILLPSIMYSSILSRSWAAAGHECALPQGVGCPTIRC